MLHVQELLDEQEDPSCGRKSDWRQLAIAAVVWSGSTAAAAGGMWLVGCTVGRHLLGVVLVDFTPENILEAAIILAGIGGFWGLVAALLIRVPHEGESSLFAWCAGITLLGAIGGALCPIATEATRGVLRPDLGSALAWVAVGLTAGLFGWIRTGRPVLRSMGRPALPSHRIMPVLGLSVAYLVAFVVTPASAVARAIFAVGLLGLAVAWALEGQERRIRELERRVLEKDLPEGDDG